MSRLEIVGWSNLKKMEFLGLEVMVLQSFSNSVPRIGSRGLAELDSRILFLGLGIMICQSQKVRLCLLVDW